MPPRTRAQLRLEAVTQLGASGLLADLLPKILEALQAAGQEEGKPQEEGLGFSKATAVVRLVCAGWRAVYDALVMRLVIKRETTDEAVGMLVRRFPAVVSVQFKWPGYPGHVVTDEGMRTVCSLLPALTSLKLRHCINITNEGVRAIGTSRSLTSVSLFHCVKITDEGVLALSNLPALTHLDISLCYKVTAAGVQAIRSTTVAPDLHIESR
jgi:hypothetical protein